MAQKRSQIAQSSTRSRLTASTTSSWKERKAKEAKAFYSVLAVATLIGLALNFTKIDPIKALVWSAIINGLTAAPVMCFTMLLASQRKVMGKLILPFYLKILGWLATAIMALAAVGMLLTSGK